jgi:hypothetical protein
MPLLTRFAKLRPDAGDALAGTLAATDLSVKHPGRTVVGQFAPP